MSTVVAVTGKGGVGKSTMAACLVRLAIERGMTPVLAVDADPNSTLAPMLGQTVTATISEIREEVLKEKANVTGVSKERILGMKLEECMVEAKGFDLLTMGHPEGPTCYCYVNTLLRGALTAMRANYHTTVVDNEAGMEHLSRMNTDNIDCMVFVTEPTISSTWAVKRTFDLSEGLPVQVHRRVLVWNKIKAHGIPDSVREPLNGCHFDEIIEVPVDEDMELLSIGTRDVFSLTLPGPVNRLLDACGLRAPRQNLSMMKG